MTIMVGAAAAKSMGDAHEYGLWRTDQALDSLRDQLNNAITRAFVASQENGWMSALRAAPMAAVQYMYNLGNALYSAGMFARI